MATVSSIESITSNLNQYLADIYHENNVGRCFRVHQPHTLEQPVKKIWHSFKVEFDPLGYFDISEIILRELKEFFKTPESEWYMKKSINSPTISIQESMDFSSLKTILRVGITAELVGTDLTHWLLACSMNNVR